MALSVISGLAPALRATGVSPVSMLRQGMAFGNHARHMAIFAAAGALVIALAVIAGMQPSVSGFPFFGYASALLLIVGFGLFAPAFSKLLLEMLSRPLKAIAPIEGGLAVQSTSANLGRVVTAVLSLTIAVAMLVSVVTMVASFRDTVIVWVNQTLRADLYIRPGAAGPNDWNNPFDPETVTRIANLPDVAAIDRFRGRALIFNGAPVVLAAGEFSVMSRYGDQLFIDGRSAADVTPRMIDQNRVIVSEPFSIKQQMGRGDTLMLPTPDGVQPFEIENVYYDYSNDRGTIVMDRSTYLRFFRDPSVTNIALYLKPGANAARAQEQLAAALPNAQLRVFANSELKRQVLRVFDQTFQVTYALEAIALIVAILGVTNTLSALIIERRGEFAMLRFVGAGRDQLKRLVLLESGMVGVIGSALGFALGLALSVVLIFVINKQSFGWTIQFVVPGWFFVQSLTLIVATTFVAGLYPAAMATRMDAIQGIRAE
jgi:putative ABC transport system permease protein